MLRTAFASSITLAILMQSGCDVQTETIKHTATGVTAPIEKVVVSVDVGDIKIRPRDDSSVGFTGEARWASQRPSVEFRADGTTLYVDSDCLDADPACRVDVELTIPRGAALEVRGGETAIDAAELRGAATLRNEVGDIRVQDLSGASLDLSTDDGEIQGSGLNNAVVVAVIGEGDTRLEFAGGAENVSVKTDVGDVDLVVPPTTYVVDARTAAGSIDVGVKQASSAKRKITAETRRGDISIQPQAILLGEPIELRFGEAIKFADEPVTLKFTEVVEDSRCPIGVVCVWAGRCIVGLTLAETGGDSHEFDLTVGTSVDALGYRVRLLDARPLPSVRVPRPEDERYILTLSVERN